MFKLVGWLLAAIFFVLGGIHAYWGTGGQWAMYIFQGVVDVPGWAAWLAALALFAAMMVILGRLGVWGSTMPQWIFRWGTGVLTAVFLIRGISGYLEVTTSPVYEFWDTWLFSPLCLFIAVCCWFLFKASGKKV